MAVTLSDIADKVGVTRTTVSMVLGKKNNSIRVSEQTRLKVLQAAQELNYVPSLTARALAKGKTGTIGFVIGGIDTPFHSEMTSMVLQEAEARGYHLLISVTQWDYEKELKCLDTLLQRQVDGILNCTDALRPGVPQYDYIIKNKFPLVPLYRRDDFSYVENDWRPGIEQAVEYLKARGYSRIGFVQLDYGKEVSNRFDRFTVFNDACDQKGIQTVHYECKSLTSAFELGRSLVHDPNRPSAMVVFSDYFATAFISGLGTEKIRVPEDMSVVGCDGTQMGAFFNPPLTSIAQDLKTIVTEGLDLLLARVENPDTPRKSLIVPSTLVIRRSA